MRKWRPHPPGQNEIFRAVRTVNHTSVGQKRPELEHLPPTYISASPTQLRPIAILLLKVHSEESIDLTRVKWQERRFTFGVRRSRWSIGQHSHQVPQRRSWRRDTPSTSSEVPAVSSRTRNSRPLVLALCLRALGRRPQRTMLSSVSRSWRRRTVSQPQLPPPAPG